MRILRVLGVLEPGGAQLSALRLARAQVALGIETRLVAGDATPQGVALARHFGLAVDVLKMHDVIGHSRRQWTPDALFANWLTERVGSADLVHAHMFGAWWAAACAVSQDVPLVASEHNALTWPLGDYRKDAAQAAARVDKFFVHGPDEALKRDLYLDAEKVLPGRSALSFHKTPRPGLVTPRLTFTGRLREDKGPDLLVRALALLPEPPTTYIVGEGPMQRELRELIEALGLQRTIRLTGWSYEPGRYVSGASVHVVPSREEAWSQSAVTALALRVPVVATAVQGLPATLADGRGVLVEPEPAAIAAAIGSVLDGRAEVDVSAGQRYAANFLPAQIATDYLAVYQQAIAQRATIRARTCSPGRAR